MTFTLKNEPSTFRSRMDAILSIVKTLFARMVGRLCGLVEDRQTTSGLLMDCTGIIV